MGKTIITAAVVGSNSTKEMNPAVPYTPKEIAKATIESCRAVAAITHMHVRDPESRIFRLSCFERSLTASDKSALSSSI